VGCSEGRLGRVLAASGHRVVGCDAAFAMVKAAVDAPQACAAVVADAVMLPLRDRAADLVIAFMCLVADYDGSVAQLVRTASTRGEISQRLQRFKGVGPKTAEIFLREVPDAAIGTA
jgi:predicted TPR repeat methyltransferase